MHAADDGAFVPLIDVLRPRPAEARADSAAIADANARGFEATVEAPERSCACDAQIARDVRVFRARLADAFDAEAQRLARELAYAVLGRELMLAPIDLAAIVARVRAQHAGVPVVRIRIAPADLDAFAVGEASAALPPAVADASLAPGDAIVELAGTTIDARFGIRLSAVLEDTP